MVLATLLFGATLLQGGPKQPAWLDTNIAGYALKYNEQFSPVGVFDPKSGFYIVRGVECDGAHLRLTLTRDRQAVVGEGYIVPNYTTPDGGKGYSPLKVKPFQSLRTGKGVQIGDTVAQVKARLGKPTKIAKTGSRKQFDELTYFWSDVKNGEGHEWSNIYTFKNGKLIEITFDREAVPGC